MTEHEQVARAGLERALARAKKVVAAASVVAALAPLSAVAAPTVGAIFSQSGGSGVFTYTYQIYNCGQNGVFTSGGCTSTGSGGPTVVAFTIPELSLGDLTFTVFPNGWSFVESLTPAFPGAVINEAGYTPGAYINFTYNPQVITAAGLIFNTSFDPYASAESGAIGVGQSRTFAATSRFQGTIDSDFSGGASNGEQFLVDPAVPRSRGPNAIPEPSTMASLGLGLAALIGLGRRKRR